MIRNPETQYQKIYLGWENPFVIAPRLNGEPLGQTFTRAQIRYLAASIDSDLYGWVFDFAVPGRIGVNIKGLALDAGGDAACEVIVFCADYPDGVVVEPVLELAVTAAPQGDTALIPPIAASVLVITVSGDYTATSASFWNSIRVNAAAAATVTLMAADAANDGKRLTITKAGAGDVVIGCPSGCSIGAAGETKLTGTTPLATVTIEYVHSAIAWIVVGGSGSWTGGVL